MCVQRIYRIDGGPEVTATINWRHHANGKNIDGATLPSGTGVRLVSRRHLMPPNEYEIYRLIPKPFWRFWGSERRLETRMEASSADSRSDTVGGWYYSTDVWYLPEPNNAAGTATFVASSDVRDGISGRLGSARIWLNEITQRSRITAEAGAQVSMPMVSVGPKGTREGSVERCWTVHVASDPWVDVTLLQGAEVLEHLISLEQDYLQSFGDSTAPAMTELPPDSATYFVDRPFDEVALTWRLEPEEGLIVSLQAPERPDMRAAVCACVTDRTDGATFVTPPTFLTNVRDKVIATDLTFDMLRPEARDVLLAFDEVDLNVDALADRFGWPLAQAWEHLADAADELGAESITDAARFAGFATPAYAS
jgi:hypothetical protein